jgi:hypothetical protein
MGFALFAAALVGSTTLTSAEAADAKWTTIKGQIVLAKGATVPEPAALNVTADKELCLKDGPVLSEEWVVNKKSGAVKNVFVWIEPADAKRGTPFPANLVNPKLAVPPSKPLEIDQPCCQFIPHALAAQAGQTLVIKNTAPKPHNAKWDSLENGQANPLLPPGKEFAIKNLKAEKGPIPLACSIHPWMKAWVRVYDHPYFAVTDGDGNFEIKDAPQGKFKVYIWHETGWSGGRAGATGSLTIDVKGDEMNLGQVPFIVPAK